MTTCDVLPGAFIQVGVDEGSTAPEANGTARRTAPSAASRSANKRSSASKRSADTSAASRNALDTVW
jgi:hypothetical protein